MFMIRNGYLSRYTGTESEVVLPYGIETIGNAAFEWCEEIEKIIIPEGVTDISEDAFYGCKNLRDVSLPSTLTSIGAGAFSGCASLHTIILPEGLENIGAGAFEWSGIESIDLPTKIRFIKNNTFRKCRNLKKVVINQNCIGLGDNAFFGCSNLDEIELSENTESIGKECFRSCSALKRIRLPFLLGSIGCGAFEDCSSLEAVILPESIKEIPDSTFAACVSLSEIKLSENTKMIGKYTFRRCSSLKKITIPSKTDIIGDYAFAQCSDMQVRFISSLSKAGKMIFPDTKTDNPEGLNEMFCTSFLTADEIRSCPEIYIPDTVTKLYSGFSSLLSYDDKLLEKTCYSHILNLNKYGCKVFIGEKYYPEDIIFENNFDFDAYDDMFTCAFNNERHIISAYRLAYPVNLSEEKRKIYISCLKNKEEAAALFAIKKNDRILLRYILSVFDVSEVFSDILYDEAKKEKHFDLLSVITSCANSKSYDLFGFDDTSYNSNWLYRETEDERIIIIGFRGNDIAIKFPKVLSGKNVFTVSDEFSSAAISTVVPDGLYYPGNVHGDVYFEYCNAHIFIPDNKAIVCNSYISDGIKYFDFNAFDKSLISFTGKDRIKAVLVRLLSPVNISDDNKNEFLNIISNIQQMNNEELMLYSEYQENKPETLFTDEYIRCFFIPENEIYSTADADYRLNKNGTLISCKTKNRLKTLILPSFIKAIGEGAFVSLTAEEIVIPPTTEKVQDGSFFSSEIKHITFCERTVLSHTVFTDNTKLETVTIINNDGEEDTLRFPECINKKDTERLAFLFAYRNPKKAVNSFSYIDYDNIDVSKSEDISRAYFRIGSINRPENGKYLEYADTVCRKMKINNDTRRIKNAIRNGYIKDGMK